MKHKRLHYSPRSTRYEPTFVFSSTRYLIRLAEEKIESLSRDMIVLQKYENDMCFVYYSKRVDERIVRRSDELDPKSNKS